MTTGHQHTWSERDRDENDNRIRTRDVCTGCGETRYGCFAKRLSSTPDMTGNRNWWGPVGVWTWST